MDVIKISIMKMDIMKSVTRPVRSTRAKTF